MGRSPSRQDDLAVRRDRRGVLLAVVKELDAASNEPASRSRQDARHGRVDKNLEVRARSGLLKVTDGRRAPVRARVDRSEVHRGADALTSLL